MAMTAEQILAILAPELSALPAASGHLELAREMTNACFFGPNAERAVALRAAHTMTLTLVRPGGGADAGAISSKSEGDLSLSFTSTVGSSGASDPDLAQTGYGVQLLALIKASGAFIGVTGGLDSGC